jgi:hypothetical protein
MIALISLILDRAVAQDQGEGRDPMAPESATLVASQLYSQLHDSGRGLDAATAAHLAATATVYEWTAEDYAALNY